MFDLPSSVQMDFKVLDIEQSPSTDLQGQYDLVIATNCIHATRNKTESILNMKTLLNSHGTIMLSEMTEIFDWVEVVWGLLDSWWLSDDSLYALQPAETWMERFRKVGLHATYSQAQSRDLNSQRLLVASNQPLSVTPKTESRLSTVVYKKVDNVEVQADILLPEHPTKTPIAIGAFSPSATT
jgi:hypothetical protein